MYSTLSAYVWWLPCILGICGLHRFYVGKPFTGLLWLFTLGLLGIGQLLDFLLIPWMVAKANRKLGMFEDRKRNRRYPIAAQAELSGPNAYDVEVVGESQYQKELEAICGGRSKESARVKTTAVLVLDDANPYDSKAVRVEIKGYVIGYLSRENARQYRKSLKKARHPRITAICKALIVGGWDRGDGDYGHFGVRLDLPTEDE